MFKWKNKFSQETLWNGEYYYEYDEVDEVIKINNQYYGTVEYGSYNTFIKLTKKEDKITKMTCDCKSKKKKCKHLAATLFYIENEDVPEKTFKHNSLTKYPKLNDNVFEKYLDADIQDIDSDRLREFLVNLLMDYDDLFKNYIRAFKDFFSDKDVEIILKKLNSILKLDIGVTEENDKFYEKIYDFLENEMPFYDNYEELSYQIYMKIYEKIVSTKFLFDSFNYSLILKEINQSILENLKKDNPKYKKFVKEELNKLLNEYPENMFNSELLELITELSDKEDIDTNIEILIKQLNNSESDSDTIEYLNQLVVLLEDNQYADEEIIRILEGLSENFYTIKILISYYTKNGKEDEAIAKLEEYFKTLDLYDTERYDTLIELKNLQRKVKHLENYKFLIIKLINEYGYYDEDDFEYLKNNDPNWDIIKKDIITLYGHYRSNLINFYLYNDMKKEFEDEVLRYYDFKEIKEYEDILIKNCPDRLQEVYEEMIYELLKYAKSSKYRKVAKILRQMKNIPNSNDNVERIIEELKKYYPKRKALIAELNKV